MSGARAAGRSGEAITRRLRLLVGALLLAAALQLAGSIAPAGWPDAAVRAADPTATPAQGGDPRSPGEGPGFVGDPLLAIGVVALVGVASVAATVAYVRLTERRRS